MSINLKNTILLDRPEDYAQIGNSRIGGEPDLPKSMEYPIFPNGFYEFILQLNLNDYPIEGLPNKGLLSMFYGSLDNNEAIGYYFEDSNELELKEVPIDKKFAGVTDFREHVSYKIKIEPKLIRSRKELPEYNDAQFTEEENIDHWKTDFIHEHSFLLHDGLEDKNDLYFKTKGFDLVSYGIRINEQDDSILYQGQDGNKDYNSIEDLKNCPLTRLYENQRFPQKATREEWIAQLEKFELEKAIHIKKIKDYTCLLSLASLEETRMIWGDLHKLEIYGFKSDFVNGNFKDLNASMP